VAEYIGDFPTQAVFYKLVDLWASGVLTELVGATLSAYKNNDATQTTTGVTLSDTSHDGIAGLHLISIDTSNAFYAAGSEVSIVITAGTLEGISQVGRVLFSFSVERANGVLARLKAQLIGTIATGTHTAQSGDSFARLGAPAGASVSADIAAIEGQTDDIGAAGAGLTAVPWNADWDAQVQSEVQDAIEANHLDHLLATASGIPAVVAGTYLDQLMDDGTATYDRTTDSLQAQRDQAALIKAKTDNLPAAPAAVGSAMTLTSGERDAVAAALLDLANGVETGKSVRKALQAMAAVLAGDVTGAGTATELFKALGNAGTTRVTVPVDEDGNRTGVTVS
jgi:hypothetical protein